MSEQSNQFKVIIAIKCVKELNKVRIPNVRCIITIQDKQKTSSLPFSEGQFFDLKELQVSKPIGLQFQIERTGKELGTVWIPIPETILSKEEVEIADDFAFDYEDKDFEGVFRGSYYIIILNKKNFIQRDDNKKKTVQFNSTNEESPNQKPQEQVLKTQGTLGQRSPLKKQSTIQIQKAKEEENQRQNSAKRLQDKVDATVKNAIKELQQSKDIGVADLDQSAITNQSQKELSSTQNPQNQRGIKRQGTVTQGQVNRSGTIIQGEIESPNRISERVLLTRSGTLAPKEVLDDDSQELKKSASPSRLEKMTTFNVDESPSKVRLNQSYTSTSPHKNTHNHEYLSTLYYIDQANQSEQLKTQTDYLKKIIYNLQAKLDSMKEAEKNCDRLVVEVQRGEQKRKEMDKLLSDAQERSKQVRTEFNQTIDQLLGEKQDLQNQLRSKQDQVTDAETKIANLLFQLQQAQNQNQQMERKLNELILVSRLVKQQEQKIDDYDKRLLENLKNYEGKIKELQQVIEGLEKQKTGLQSEINKGQQQANQLKGDLNVANYKIKELGHQNQSLERQLQLSKTQEINIKSLNEQVVLLKKDIAELNRQKNTIEKDNQNLRKENGSLKGLLLDSEKQSNDKQAGLRQKIIELETKVSSLSNEQDNLNKSNIALRQEIKSLQLNACLSEDLMKQCDEEKARCDQLLRLNKESQQREKELQTQLTISNQQLYEARTHINDLNKQLSETQQYCAQLKKLILEMKETGVAYIPFHNDPIDVILADFINSLHDPSRLINMFVRESEGVYLFGQKKVYLKVEQERILIRTGGGFMGIEEFLDVFAPSEIEKMRETDPKKDYERNQQLNKTIEGAKVIKQIKSQTSPLKNRTQQ